MNGYFPQATAFLISVVFGLYILVVMLRFLLQWVRADFYNPLSQFVVKLTTPVLKPLRRVIPGWGGVDVAALVLLLALQLVELILMYSIAGQALSPGLLLVDALGRLVTLALYIFIITIIVQAILSWIQPGGYNPVAVLLYQISAPILRPFRNLIPPISGIDLSPLAALVVLYLILMAVPYMQRALVGLTG